MVPITECQVETPRGDATFAIVGGDISRSHAEVIVVSASAHAPLPGGAAVDALAERFGWSTLEGLRRFTGFSKDGAFSLGPNRFEAWARYAGTWAGPLDDGKRTLVVVRLPGASHLGDPEAAYGSALDAVIATLGGLAALQARRFAHVAFTDLGGTRGFPVDRRLAAVTQRLARWFAGPSGCDHVELVLFDDGSPGFAEQTASWREAMQRQQGWVLPGSGEQVTALMQDVRALVLARAEAEPAGAPMREILLELGQRLDPVQRRSVQEIAQPGRKLAEVVSGELCADHGLPVSQNTYANLERLQNAPHRVARWVLSYLHTLRTLGNEASHAAQLGEDRFPRTIVEDDLLVLLAHVRRVIDFRSQWARHRPVK